MTTTWNDIILSALSASSPLGVIVMGVLYYKENKRRKKLDNDKIEFDLQKESDLLKINKDKAIQQVSIDAATRSRLVEEAAIINEEHEQRREDWWLTQLKVLRSELASQIKLSNKRFKRLLQLENWATEHIVWDRRAWSKAKQVDENFELPPEIPEEDE